MDTVTSLLSFCLLSLTTLQVRGGSTAAGRLINLVPGGVHMPLHLTHLLRKRFYILQGMEKVEGVGKERCSQANHTTVLVQLRSKAPGAPGISSGDSESKWTRL